MKQLIALMTVALLAGRVAAQSLAPDTLAYDRFQTYNSRWPIYSTKNDVVELTALGLHIKCAGTGSDGIVRAAPTFTLNDKQDWSFTAQLRVTGRGGLLFGDTNYDRRKDNANASFQVFMLELDRAQPQVSLRRYNGQWTEQFALLLPAGFNRNGNHQLTIARQSNRYHYYVDNKQVKETDVPGQWPGIYRCLGFYVEQAGTSSYVREVLIKHHSLIRLATGATHKLRRERLLQGISTLRCEIEPIVSADGRSLFFSRRLGPAIDNKPNDDIYLSEGLSDGRWSEPRNIGPPVNSRSCNYIYNTSPDGKTIAVSGDSGEGWVKQSTLQPAGSWSEPVPLFGVEMGHVTDAFIDASGQLALMGRYNGQVEKADGTGLMYDEDICVSYRRADGSWTAPKSLGSDINTLGEEKTPFLAPDGKTLYFASDTHSGYGGTDVFMSRRLDDSWTRWSTPLNLGPSVNTPGFEQNFSLPASGKYAYFSSQEPGTEVGDWDIYCLSLIPALRPNATVLIKGRVLDAKTKQPIASAQVQYERLPTGQRAGTVPASVGTFKIALPAGQQYGFSAAAVGYLSASETLDLSETKQYGEVVRDLLLTPIEKGQKVQLNNLFFAKGSPNLLPGSTPELERLAQVMKDNAGLKIRLDGHTDNTGDNLNPQPNLQLSRQRAEAVKSYLVAHGVPAGHLSTQGFGGSRPTVPNTSEANKVKNRRVECVVLSQ